MSEPQPPKSIADILMEQSQWVSALATELDIEIAGMRGKAEELEMRADDLETTKVAYERRAEALFDASVVADALEPDADASTMGAEYLIPAYGAPLVEVHA